MSGITNKQEAFALAYIETGNASEAYRRAYDAEGMKPNTINVKASELLKSGKVAARVEELRAPALLKAGLTAERTLQEVARLAYFDPRKLYREDGNLKRPDEWDDDTAAAIGSIEVTEEFQGRGEERELSGFTKKIKPWDKNSALEKAMKHLGLFKEDNAQQRESLVLRVEVAKPVKR